VAMGGGRQNGRRQPHAQQGMGYLGHFGAFCVVLVADLVEMLGIVLEVREW